MRRALARLGAAVGRWIGVQDLREITIAQSLLADLSDMARDGHPNEVLVFLASTQGIRDGVLHIDEIHVQAYEASEDSAHVWLSHLPTVSSIVGTAHSHPGGSRRPSDADRHFWSKEGIVHIIIPEPYRVADMVYYDKNGRRIAVRAVA